MDEDNKGFPLEKILTVSAGDYAATKNGLDNYELKGIHATFSLHPNYLSWFAEHIPQNAEVVTDLRVTYTPTLHHGLFVSATVLIPKDKMES